MDGATEQTEILSNTQPAQEEALREEYESNSALRELDMRELEEALRELVGFQYEIREPLNGNLDEQLLSCGKVIDFFKEARKRIKTAIKEKLNKPAAPAE